MIVTIRAAKAKLSKLIDRAQGGDEIIISLGGVPKVRLVPIVRPASARRPGTLRGKIKIPTSFFDPLPPGELEPTGDAKP